MSVSYCSIVIFRMLHAYVLSYVCVSDRYHFLLLNSFFPNDSYESRVSFFLEGEDRAEYKHKFCNSFLKICKDLLEKGRHVIVVGDINIAHEPIDNSYFNKEERACFTKSEREWFSSFLSGGFVDSFRHFHPEEISYTWWDPKLFKRDMKKGIRLDYCLVSQNFLSDIISSSILSYQLGSDHCPCLLIVEEKTICEKITCSVVPLSSSYNRKVILLFNFFFFFVLDFLFFL
eukprot:TRINITY_DN546_c0_g2_i12.p1 TRINITY_DN546_c0_g2~~TRINITY_DN546_c0_g2_i12.p1  ORF type:complete len:231 (-),score=35.04 TRINITY_DN546_c0_g2_i12:71-763(-)